MSRLASRNQAVQETFLKGRYLAIEVLSRVQWGQTYVAVDTYQPGNPKCLIKQLCPVVKNAESLQAARELFNREVKILETLGQHEQVVTLLDALEVEEAFYLIYEYIEGQSLSVELSSGQPWSERQVIQLLQDLLESLEFIHSQGVIHGELKPENFIRRKQDNRLILTDFSAIKQVRTPLVDVPFNMLVSAGSSRYLASEQILGKPRPSSDIYALGMIAIAALTGRIPSQLEENPETGEVIWRQWATISDEFAAIVTQMVRYYFKDRYQSASDVLKALQLLLSPKMSTPSPSTQSTPLLTASDATGDTSENGLIVSIGQLIKERYQILELLSSTSSDRTYLAIDTHRPTNPRCVVKALRPFNRDPDSLKVTRELFEREVKILETLSEHNQIARLVECFEIEPTFYLVQEFIEGQPLSAELALGGNWSEPQVVKLLQEVLSILGYIHSQGVVYGNLQPDNLIRRSHDENLVLTYFSCLKQAQPQLVAVQAPVNATMLLGALGYMAMEQVCGEPRPSSDIYALGVIALQALTGLNPMELEEDPQTGELLWQHQATVSEPLAAILTRMVRYHFKERYQTVVEVWEALRSLANYDPSIQLTLPPKPSSVAPSTVLPGLSSSIELETLPTSSLPIELEVSPSSLLPPSPPLQKETPSPSIEVTSDQESATVVAPSQEPQASMPEQLTASNKPSNRLNMQTIAGIATYYAFVAVGGYLLWNLPDQGLYTMTQATQKYEEGELEEAIALAESISPKSEAYEEAQAVVEQWQYAQANPELEQQARQLLQQAYKQAIARDFVGALNALQQIPEGTKAYSLVQTKLTEYAEKRNIRADYLLWQARAQAMERNFTEALAYLRQIPPDTPAYEPAQQKILEYTEKQRIKEAAQQQIVSSTETTTVYPSQQLFTLNQFSDNNRNASEHISTVPDNFNPGNSFQEVKTLS